MSKSPAALRRRQRIFHFTSSRCGPPLTPCAQNASLELDNSLQNCLAASSQTILSLLDSSS